MMTIKQRLLISFLAVSLIPIFIIGVISFSSARDALENAQIASLETIADLKVDKIKTFFREREGMLKIVQESFNIKAHLTVLARNINDRTTIGYVSAKSMLDKELKKLQETFGYVDVMLVSPKGEVVYVSNDAHSEKDLGNLLPDPDGRTFEEGKHGIYFSDVFINKVDNNRFGMLMSAPITDMEGAFIGLIVVEVVMDPIFQFIQDTTGLGKTGETLIGKKRDHVALFLNPLRHDENAALQRSVQIGGEMAMPVQEAVQGRHGSGLSVDYRREEVIAAWRYIPSMDWGMVAKIDAKEAFASVARFRNLILFLGVATLILSGTATFVIAHSIAKPIASLQKSMEIVGKGNLEQKVGTDAEDEMGQLSRAFDQMVINLKTATTSHEALNKEVAQRKRAEASLRSSEAKVRAIVENMADGIITIDEAGMIETFNPAAERIFGYTAEEVRAKNVKLLMPSPDHEAHDDYLMRYRNGGEARIIGIGREVVGQRKDGACFPVDLSVAPMHLVERRFFVGIVRDITERKDAEQALKTLNETLEEQVAERTAVAEQRAEELARANEELQQFTSIASHDLKEPLRKVVAFGGILEEDYGPVLEEEGRGYLKKMRKASMRMEKLIDSLLTLSRVTTKARPFEPVHLENAARDALQNLEVAITDSKGTVEIADLPTIDADPTQMFQLFQNLVGNGLKYHKKDTFPVVKINSPASANGDCTITVEDNGIGFDERYLDKIFKPFQRLHGKNEFAGSGMGLAICEKIVRRHGGVMTAKSRPGRGTTFIVTLPRSQACEAIL